ncbi:MAG: hypothetical protein ACRC5M_02135 [Anaeroplasmataceae bacterium]
MSIVWFSDKSKNLIATISDLNITLNKPASNLIEDAYNVMLGINGSEQKVYIKSYTKEEVIRGDLDSNSLYLITTRASYSRVTNKEFIKQIKKVLNVKCFEKPKKYLISFNESSKTLVIDLKGEVE